MANNHFLTINTKFRPFSYQEMLAPITAYQNVYDTSMSNLDNLSILSEDIGSKITNEKDKKLKEQYVNYKKSLDTAIADLMDSGLNQNTRKNILKLKSAYAKDIKPIDDAYKAYVEDVSKYRDMVAANPHMIIEGVGDSISDYLGGKKPELFSANSNEILKHAAEVAKAASSRTLRDTGWFEDPSTGGKTLARFRTMGIKESDLNKAFYNISRMYDGEIDPSQLSNQDRLVLESFEAAKGAVDYGRFSSEGQRRIDEAVIKGLREGFTYSEDPKYLENPAYTPGGGGDSPTYPDGSQRPYRPFPRYTKGENERVGQIISTLSEGFGAPINMNGTLVYDPIQAYNMQFANDKEINEITDRITKGLKEGTIKEKKNVTTDVSDMYKVLKEDGTFDFAATEKLKSDIKRREQLSKERADFIKKYGQYMLSEKDIKTLEDYVGTKTNGPLTEDFLTSLINKSEFDISTRTINYNTVNFASNTDNKNLLEDMTGTVNRESKNLIAKGTTPEIKKITKDGNITTINKNASKNILNGEFTKFSLDYQSYMNGGLRAQDEKGNEFILPFYLFGANIVDLANAYYGEFDKALKGTDITTANKTSYQINQEQDTEINNIMTSLKNRMLDEFALNYAQEMPKTNSKLRR